MGASRAIVVGIAGGTCTGKTRLARVLVGALTSNGVTAAYLSQDWYYRDLSHVERAARDRINFDVPAAIDGRLLREHLMRLRDRRDVVAPSYDRVEHVRTGEGNEVESAEVVVAEGIFLCAEPRLRQLIDVAVYLAVPDDVRLIRRIRRDVIEYGRPLEQVLVTWESLIRPMHQQHVAPAADRADVVLDYETADDERRAVDLLLALTVERRREIAER